jgi:hypothetical protein
MIGSLAIGSSFALNANAAVTYQLDTIADTPPIGSPTAGPNLFPVGLEPQPNYNGRVVGDLLWLNSYKVETGGEVLNSIGLTWGAPATANRPGNSGYSDWQRRPYSATVLLYSDPNNDGNPADAQLLAQADTTIANPDTTRFTNVAIAPTTLGVGQTFFVGAVVRNLERNQRPATAQLGNPVANRSWFAIGNHGDDQPSNIDINNLSNNFRPTGTSQSPTLLPQIYGNWVVRSYGDAAPRQRVSEPGLIVGFGTLLLTATIARRRR